ncbi:MAG: hypothetical protein IPJ97_17350 [Proteobacteria bacterium]|nr:hypothetical protein [Pseudomonadota bacterium]
MFRVPILVSTPVHIRALLESGVAIPETSAVVSATAPLSAELATIERRFGTVLLEFSDRQKHASSASAYGR